MPYLQVNPRYHEMLQRQGLRAPADFLDLPAVIVSGHPDRNVARVVLEGPGQTVAAFLKREHCIRWKDRVLNALAGFGLVSKSRRECAMLQAFARANIGCAEWIAVGEDGGGRAFLLIRALEEASDLRIHLRDRFATHPRGRRRFAVRLGKTLARMHNAGFDHPDLYSKHIAVDGATHDIRFLDIQRSRCRKVVLWPRRWADLAALEATLSEEHLPAADRVACLRSYLRTCRSDRVPLGTNLMHSAFRITRFAARLLTQRRIQEIRSGPCPGITQRLIWLDGEALCVTPEFKGLLSDPLPEWLKLPSLPEFPREIAVRQTVALQGAPSAVLVRRRTIRLLAGLWNWARRRTLVSPELRQSGILFRLQRAGIRTPKLLAFGQRQALPWRIESFLLTEPASGVSLRRWLTIHGGTPATRGGLARQRSLIEEIARVLRTLHEARCYLNTTSVGESLLVHESTPSTSGTPGTTHCESRLTIAVANVTHIRMGHGASHKCAKNDLKKARNELGSVLRTRTDEMRFVLAYLRLNKLNPEVKRFVRSYLHRRARPVTQVETRGLRVAWAKVPLPGRSAAS